MIGFGWQGENVVSLTFTKYSMTFRYLFDRLHYRGRHTIITYLMSANIMKNGQFHN